jgi:hypothetical protein
MEKGSLAIKSAQVTVVPMNVVPAWYLRHRPSDIQSFVLYLLDRLWSAFFVTPFGDSSRRGHFWATYSFYRPFLRNFAPSRLVIGPKL